MPWAERTTMEAKVKFIGAVLDGEESMTEVCERFGVSRTAGYQLLRRYVLEGMAALRERSRAPHRAPWAISQAQQEAILMLRDRHPHWGPKSLRPNCVRKHQDNGGQRSAP